MRRMLKRGARRADRFLDRADPLAGQVVGRAFEVVQRDDLVLQGVVQAFGVGRVLGLPVGGLVLFADGPAVAAVEALAPPAVQDGEVERAVEGGLLPGGPEASFGRPGVFSQTSTPWTR